MGEWYPCGTGQGFADWLYLYRKEVTPHALGHERLDYIADCLQMYEDGIGANEVFAQAAAKDDEARVRYEKVSHDASALLTQLRASVVGQLAFAALRALATSSGRSMGKRKQSIASLELLKEFRAQLWGVMSRLDTATLNLSFGRFPSFRRRDWADFAQVERLLRQEPLSNRLPPRQSYSQLIAVCVDASSGQLIEAELTRLKMLVVINAREAPAGPAPRSRRLRIV